MCDKRWVSERLNQGYLVLRGKKGNQKKKGDGRYPKRQNKEGDYVAEGGGVKGDTT